MVPIDSLGILVSYDISIFPLAFLSACLMSAEIANGPAGLMGLKQSSVIKQKLFNTQSYIYTEVRFLTLQHVLTHSGKRHPLTKHTALVHTSLV